MSTPDRASDSDTASTSAPAGMQFGTRMTDYEALMWNIEKDPWLSSNIGGISILDTAPDFDELRLRMRSATAQIPRLRQRVLSGLGRLAPPTWVTDQEFDLDYHLRRVALPGDGTRRELLDLASELLQDPFDRTRPQWQFYVIDGLEDGRSALFTKLHHTIADGTTAVILAGHYMTFERAAAPPEDVDLDALIASEKAEHTSITSQAIDAAGELSRKLIDAVASAAGEVVEAVFDPERLQKTLAEIVDTVRVTSEQVSATESQASPLWSTRSRNRHVETLSLPFEEAKDAAHRLGGKLNDLFLTGAVEAAHRYHETLGVDRDSFTVSFAINTRGADAADDAGNEFTLVPTRLPGGAMKLDDRFKAVQDRVSQLKNEMRSSGRGAEMMNALAGVMNLLPTSVVTTTTRNRAAHIDFATSNVPASPVPMYICGAQVEEIYPVGPLAGTAFNATMVSYDGKLFLGINVDPVSVSDPALLRGVMDEAYTELIGG